MRLIINVLLIGAVVIIVAGIVGLAIASGIAGAHGVERVQVPEHSYIAGDAAEADYADAYRAPMEYSAFRNIDQVIANAFQKGRELYRSDSEVVYEGRGRGVRFIVDYILDLNSSPPTITVATSVHYVTRAGRAYFRVVKPVHRMGVPYMVDRMAQAAAAQ